MAVRCVVGTLVIVCFIILHVECWPRIGRDDDSRLENGSGYEDSISDYDEEGASDAEDWSTEDTDPNSSKTVLTENPIDYGNNVGVGNEITTQKPTALPIPVVGDYYDYEESSNESDNSVGISEEDIDSGRQETPISAKEHKTDDKELDLDLEEGAGPSESNERDQFFGKPEAVKPSKSVTVGGMVGVGAIRTDVMAVFDDDDYYYDDYDDSQLETDPEVVSLERGEYKKDDFFDTIGMKKLDDFIPKATETKKAQHFIEGHAAGSIDMSEIFGEKSGSGGKTMKDDFFDSIGVKNIVIDKVGLDMKSLKKDNRIYGSISKIGTNGPGSKMTFEEDLKMQQLILTALRSFIGSPCYKNGRLQMTEKCAVFEDVLNALAISGLTFSGEDRIASPKATKSARKWQW